MRTLRNRRRGSATVELAIMMVVLVPVIMYYLFLEDALFFKLDGQETTVTAPFDAVTLNHNIPLNGASPPPGVYPPNPDQGRARLEAYVRSVYCDHTSAYDSYNVNHDCDKAIHHTEHGAHQCWISGGAKQIECEYDMSSGNEVVGGVAPPHNFGGLMTCKARLGILNKIIINKFLWGKVDVSGRLSQFEGNAHDEKDDADEGNTILLQEERLALMVDPWAVNELDPTGATTYDPVNPNTPSPDSISKRSETYFNSYYGTHVGSKVTDLLTSLGDFVKADVAVDGTGDNPATLPIFYASEKTRERRSGEYASGWADSRQAGIATPSLRPATYPW